jgi:5,10-methylene-tetrahydrofolate dehydrogenase/methenyl tetrahydrofolate cyclohydrolase
MVKDGVVVIDVGITRVPDETKEKGYDYWWRWFWKCK